MQCIFMVFCVQDITLSQQLHVHSSRETNHNKRCRADRQVTNEISDALLICDTPTINVKVT
jgi:hypothetical protein